MHTNNLEHTSKFVHFWKKKNNDLFSLKIIPVSILCIQLELSTVNYRAMCGKIFHQNKILYISNIQIKLQRMFISYYRILLC